MASASQSFPSRPYSSALHGKLPDRGSSIGGGGAGGFGIGVTRGGGGGGPSGAGGNTNMPQITDEQREEINEAFSLFDLDKDQRIDYHEFKVSLKALGFTLPKPDLLNLLTTHGIPPPPKPPKNPRAPPPPQNEPVHPSRLQITLQSFQGIAANLIGQRDPRDEILRAFELFDADEKGVITLDDLRRVARELGEGLEEEEMVAMIEEFDMDGKGGVGKEEFLQICLG